jgi:CRP-like cAMP-binding protein
MSALNELLLRRACRLARLSDEDKDAIRALPIEEADVGARQDLARTHEKPSRSILIASGLAATYKDTLDGKRQIHAFHQEGDMPDLHSLHLTTLDITLSTLTPCKIGFMRHDHLRALCEKHPRITAGLWRSTLIDASIHREWITNLGQRQAPARMAHLFCEVIVRMEVAGLAETGHARACRFPVTQTVLAEALGMSIVHVNRTLQELRDANLLSFDNGRLEIFDWRKLVRVAGFDATYLHLDDEDAKRYAA